MAEIKYNELASKPNLLLTDLLGIADENGVLFRTDLQDFQNYLVGLGVSGYKGSIDLTSPAPTEDGLYAPTISGTYQNFNNEVVDLNNQLVLISVESNQTVFKQIPIPLSITQATIDSFIENGIVKDSTKLAKSGDSYSHTFNLKSNSYSCFAKNKSVNDFNPDAIAQLGVTYDDIYSAFKSVQLIGLDNTKRYKMSFIRKNHNTNNTAIQVMQERAVGDWFVIFYMNVSDLTLNDDGVTFIDFTHTNGVRMIAYVDFSALPDGLNLVLEANKITEEPAYFLKNSCISVGNDSTNHIGQSEALNITQKGFSDVVLTEPNQTNVFNVNKVRKGFSINSATPYSIGSYTLGNIVLSGFYKIPENCKRISYGGVIGAGIFARFSEEPTDNGNAFKVNMAYGAGRFIDIDSNLKKYKYVVFTVFRGGLTDVEDLSNVFIKFETNEQKEPSILTPRKPIIAFHMDCVNLVSSNLMSEYVEVLEEYGHYKSTYNILPTAFTADYLDFYRKLDLKGNEIAIHSDTSYNLSASSTLTDSEFKEAVVYYINRLKVYGFDCTGWVSLNGNLKTNFIPLIKKYLNWACVLPNISVNTPSLGVNDITNDNFDFRRSSIEYPAPYSPADDTAYLNLMKQAVDDCVANNGYLIFYAHSYKDLTRAYTLREEIFIPLLAYIKTYVDKYEVEINKTTNELMSSFYTTRLND